VNVAGVTVEWNVNAALVAFVGVVGFVSMTVSGGVVLPKEYVLTSKVRPSSSVGATVTDVPDTVTFKKWKTLLAEVGAVAAPHFVPLSDVGDQPMP
jgi:hypothetical protein